MSGRFAEWVVRVALTPAGMALDRSSVRLLGHSPVSWLFARAERVEYNAPILLETIGRKSGAPRVVVLPIFDAGEGRVAVVGSRGGMPTDPHWARNLRASGDSRICRDRRWQRAHAALAQGEERERLWKEISERAPVYLEYQERAREHREIPLFVVTIG